MIRKKTDAKEATADLTKKEDLQNLFHQDAVNTLNCFIQFNEYEEDDSHLSDFIEDKKGMPPDSYANSQLLKDEINAVLSTLTEREEKVLRLRFGLEDGRNRTLEEVSKEFDVTRERIRQIEAKALRKLKKAEKIDNKRAVIPS